VSGPAADAVDETAAGEHASTPGMSVERVRLEDGRLLLLFEWDDEE
jgi:hypothetical protein